MTVRSGYIMTFVIKRLSVPVFYADKFILNGCRIQPRDCRYCTEVV